MKHCGVEERLAGQTGQHGAWDSEQRQEIQNNTVDDDDKAVEIGRQNASREKK